MCHCSLAAVTPVKYEYDSKYYINIFLNIGNYLNGEINMLQPLNQVIIGSNNGMSSVWHQAIT